MTHSRFVQHDGVSILVVDYSRARGSDLDDRLAEAEQVIRAQPRRSVLILAHVTDIEFSARSTKLLLDHVTGNAPFSLATAVVGLQHLSGTIPVANRLTGRDLRSFDDETAAMKWLASMKPAGPPPDEKVRFVDHHGEALLWIDFRGASKEELRVRLATAASIIRSSPPLSVLTLTLLHGITYNEETTSLMKDYVRLNRPFVLAAAVVGLDYLRRIVFPLNRLTGRKLRAFDDIETAQDWLVEEKRRQLGL